jgi:helicase
LPAYKVIIRDYKRYSQYGFMDIPVLEFHQMAGRAGRPGLEFVGHSVLCVKTENELSRVTQKYVFGQPEEVLSKLAIEPILKMYVLSLIAMNMINTKDEIKSFFANTLYAYQFQDLDSFNHNLFRIINVLKDYGFVEQDDDYFVASPMGKKVSELYLNPDTANYFLENIDKFIKIFSSGRVTKYDEYSLIFFITDIMEMKPLFTLRKEDEEKYQKRAEEVSESLIMQYNPYEMDYKTYLQLLKISDIFNDWINEVREDNICETYKITPGELNFKLEVVDWILYCLEEISLLKKSIYFKNYLNKFRQRFKFGIRDNLIALVSLKGIGRVRARMLYKAGFRKLEDIRNASLDDLTKVIPMSVSLSLKEQLQDTQNMITKPFEDVPKEINKREVSDREVELLLENDKMFAEEKKKAEKGGLLDYF